MVTPDYLFDCQFGSWEPYMISTIDRVLVVNLADIKIIQLQVNSFSITKSDGVTETFAFSSNSASVDAYTKLEQALYEYLNPQPWYVRLWRKIMKRSGTGGK